MIYFVVENCSAIAPLVVPVSLRTVNSFSFLLCFNFYVDEARFELVRLRLQRSALPLELFVHFVLNRFLTDILFPHHRTHLFQTNCGE